MKTIKWYDVIKTQETYPPYEDGGPVQKKMTCGVDAFVNAFQGIVWTVKQECTEAKERRIKDRVIRKEYLNNRSNELGMILTDGY